MIEPNYNKPFWYNDSVAYPVTEDFREEVESIMDSYKESYEEALEFFAVNEAPNTPVSYTHLTLPTTLLL